MCSKSAYDILYKHYCISERCKRQNALELLELKEYSAIPSHYLVTNMERVKLHDGSMSLVLRTLRNIEESLKDTHCTEPVLTYITEGESTYTNEEDTFNVEWVVYTVADASKCERLAACWTNEALFNLKKRPEGKDALAISELLEVLQT